jgi:TolB-like protein
MGVHVGDVNVEGDDLHGDGINIAARIEAVAEPGGLCLSADAWRQVRGRAGLEFDDLGEHQLKNIAEPMGIHRARLGHPGEARALPPLPEGPSIAVLPLATMGGGDEEEGFADGLTDDLITDLSRQPGFFVIARHSSFAWKGRAGDLRHVARDLGVRYILEGSARRSGGRVRINAQPIDAQAGGSHLWAERLDRGVEDVFAVQDEVTARIVGALVGRLVAAPPPRYRPSSIEACDLCVRGRMLVVKRPA